MKNIHIHTLLLILGVVGCGDDPSPPETPEPSEMTDGSDGEDSPGVQDPPETEDPAANEDPAETEDPVETEEEAEPMVERDFLTVPMDEDNEDAGTLELAFIRIRQDTESGAEPILVHFGGPGVSAVDVLPRFVEGLPSEFRNRYTFIGLDEIGVGGSPELSCTLSLEVISPDTLTTFLHPFLGSSAEELEGFGRATAATCADDPLVDQAGTPRYARDIDRLRETLGYERLNIFGASYGSEVALHYAALFPDRVGRIVLDSPVDPRRTFQETLALQAQASTSAFDKFLAWCDDQPECAVDVDELNALIDDLAAQTDEQGVAAASNLLNAITEYLPVEFEWPQLAEVLQTVLADPSVVGAIEVPPPVVDVPISAFLATTCNDFPIGDVAEIEAVRTEFENNRSGQLSPRFDLDRFDRAFPCVFLGGEADRVPWDSTLPALGNANSILITSAIGDTQTPRAFTERLVDALPEISVVSVDEVSHSAALRGVNPCLDGAVIDFFNEGTVSVTECEKSARPSGSDNVSEETTALFAP